MQMTISSYLHLRHEVAWSLALLQPPPSSLTTALASSAADSATDGSTPAPTPSASSAAAPSANDKKHTPASALPVVLERFPNGVFDLLP